MDLSISSENIKLNHMPKTSFNVTVLIILISDSLCKLGELWGEKDKSGKIAIDSFTKPNYHVMPPIIIADDSNLITDTIKSNVDKNQKDIIVTIGGTGIAPRDVTIEAVRPLLQKELPGFGEIFRAESYKEIGSMALMTRALAGVRNKTIIICLPGSPNATKTGLNLIMPEIEHILNLLGKKT